MELKGKRLVLGVTGEPPRLALRQPAPLSLAASGWQLGPLALAGKQPEWTGTATELTEFLQVEMQPNALSRKLNVSLERLLIEYGIQYRSERGHEGRRIYLTYMGSQRDDM